MKLASLLIALASLPASAVQILLTAGPLERINTPILFDLPAGINPAGAWILQKDNEQLPLQIIGKRALFIVPRLAANSSATYAFVSVPHATRPPLPTDVHAHRDKSNVTFAIGKREIFRYNGEKTALPEGFDPQYARGAYLFPLMTPSGVLVADDYPPMHKHHHGVWFSWTRTGFDGRKPDFWNMGQKTGTVEFVSLDEVFAGPLAAWISSTHGYVDLTAKPPATALNETWQIIAYTMSVGGATANVFDITVTHACATDKSLTLPKYHYGGIAFRGRRDWNGVDAKDKNAPFNVLTSEAKDKSSANESAAAWCAMTGPAKSSDGAATKVSFALIDHPANFRSPQPLRVHPTEPYFCYAPQVQGEFAIEPGKPYISRYRAVIADGAPDKALLDRLAGDWTKPVSVEIK